MANGAACYEIPHTHTHTREEKKAGREERSVEKCEKSQQGRAREQQQQQLRESRKNWQFNIWRFLRDLFKQYTWEFVLMLRQAEQIQEELLGGAGSGGRLAIMALNFY